MAKLKKIDLPRKYEYLEGVSRPEYKKYDGWNKVSYSQITSFRDDLYRGNYIGGYFLGHRDESGIFAQYGSDCGNYWEDNTIGELLSDEDVRHLNRLLPRKETSSYETEIVVDLEPFGLERACIQGFIDQEDEPEEGKLIITDLKTGNHKDKPDFYASPDYNQTTLYSYCRELEGYEILKSQVYLLERKGNTLDKDAISKAGNPLFLRLSGKMLTIDTPYSKERAENFLEGVVKTCIEISEYYKVYNKYFK